jgi:hypothetical protein
VSFAILTAVVAGVSPSIGNTAAKTTCVFINFFVSRITETCRESSYGRLSFVVVNRAHKIEFNVLNPYLIVLAGLRLIFDHDGKRMPKASDEVVTTSHS